MRAAAGLAGLALACIASLPASAQLPAGVLSGDRLEMGARVCGPDQLLDETPEEYRQRLAAERDTPDWIWTAIDGMQSGPDRMTFTVREFNGERILFANGAIDEKANENLKAALKRHAPVAEVWFNSPGGNSRVGVEMGHTLRAEGVITMVKAGHGCASACSTAFLGGMLRKVEPGAVYGVHMYSTQLSGSGPALSQDIYNDIQWQGAMGATERIFFAQEMGVTRKWASIWSSTRPGCMTFMSQAELSASLVNNLLD